ncbi:sulfurtransferase TusA family protein [Salinicola endophyticus]|uniref:Sulfurtransferase TusA family protein n=1 Tax=Salinicola endophyticus TaxID=1949083 RepID=A0ABY8FKI1_9GAMM|nr:sulfurtransferase TusA family protein [Salinicola endophyticus]WFF41676.1 sulfurtransferase TusA family protein [Salinicola endophyticus]
MSHAPDHRLDASGLSCPLPLLKAKQVLAGMQPGELLEVVATDAGSWQDFASFAAHSRHTLVDRTAEAGSYRYWLRKMGKDSEA